MSYKQPLINAIYRLSLFLLLLCSIGASELYAKRNYQPRGLGDFASTQEKTDWVMDCVAASNAINILFANHSSLKAQYLVCIARREFTKANLVVRKIDSETLSDQQKSYKEYLLNQENRQIIVDEVELIRGGRRLYDGIEDAEVLSGGELGNNEEKNIEKAPQISKKKYSRNAFELAAKLTREHLEKEITFKPLFHYQKKAGAQDDQKIIEGGTTPKQVLTGEYVHGSNPPKSSNTDNTTRSTPSGKIVEATLVTVPGSTQNPPYNPAIDANQSDILSFQDLNEIFNGDTASIRKCIEAMQQGDKQTMEDMFAEVKKPTNEQEDKMQYFIDNFEWIRTNVPLFADPAHGKKALQDWQNNTVVTGGGTDSQDNNAQIPDKTLGDTSAAYRNFLDAVLKETEALDPQALFNLAEGLCSLRESGNVHAIGLREQKLKLISTILKAPGLTPQERSAKLAAMGLNLEELAMVAIMVENLKLTANAGDISGEFNNLLNEVAACFDSYANAPDSQQSLLEFKDRLRTVLGPTLFTLLAGGLFAGNHDLLNREKVLNYFLGRIKQEMRFLPQNTQGHNPYSLPKTTPRVHNKASNWGIIQKLINRGKPFLKSNGAKVTLAAVALGGVGYGYNYLTKGKATAAPANPGGMQKKWMFFILCLLLGGLLIIGFFYRKKTPHA